LRSDSHAYQSYTGPFEANAKLGLGLFAKDKFGEAKITFVAVANGIKGESKAIKATDRLDVLPCTLYKKSVTLTDGGAGFTISVRCSKTVTNGELRMKGYAAKRYETIEADKKVRLITFSTSGMGDVEMKFVGDNDGSVGESSTIKGNDADSE